MIPVLVKLTENDKRLILALLLIVILLFVIIGLIGALIIKVMKKQGKKLDSLTYDVVKSHLITDKKKFKKYARRKNWRLFFLESWKPLLIMFVGSLVLIIRDAVTRDFSYNVFDYKVTGFNTFFFVWDFSHIFKALEGGFVFKWPPLISTPHWSNPAWASYIFMPCMIVGGVWYLIAVQSVIARTLRMHELMDSIYEKSLEGYNQNEDILKDKNNN